MRTDHLALLYRVSQTFSSSLDLDHVLDHIMDEAIAATRAERGVLMLRDSEGQLTFRIARGMDQRTIEAPEFQISRGVVEQVAREGQPLLTSNAQFDAQLGKRASVVGLGLRSILCVPLLSKGASTGVIYVDSSLRAGIFDHDDLELFVAIAQQAATAIENASLFCDVQDKLHALRLLQEISADLTSTLDLEQVLAACLQRILDLLAAESASILIVEGNELVFRLALGKKAAEIKPFRIPLDQGIAGWVVQNAQGIYSNDVHNDPRFYAMPDNEIGFVTQALMAVPLIVNERAIGVVEVINKPGGFGKGDLDLLSTIAASAAIAIDNARLYQLAVEKGRLERELQLARQVQASLIPRQTPQLPGWQLATRWIPARQVSGDFCDFIDLSQVTTASHDIGIVIVIADVADKGMPAALFMTLTRSIIRASVAQLHTPAESMTHANRLICADAHDGMFVTLFYAQLNPATGEMICVNAGHNRPLLYRAAGDQLTEIECAGIVLGVDDKALYSQCSVPLHSGDLALLYTDGVIDATDPQRQQFGLERLKDILYQHRLASAPDIIAALERTLGDFAGGSLPFDDITMLLVKRL